MARISTIYEVRYFYAGLAALGRHKGVLKEGLIDEVIRQELTRFNNNRARKYNLPERSVTFRQTPYFVLYELRLYGLVQIIGQGGDRKWSLTDEGWRLYELLKSPANSQKLREEFIRLTLDTFPLFTDFLNILNHSSHNKTLGIPHLAQSEFVDFEPEQSEKAIHYAVITVSKVLEPRFNLDNQLYEQLRAYLKTVLIQKLEKGKKLPAILEVEITRFFSNYFFKGLFNNEVLYEVVRTRAVFLGLANYYREGPPSRCLELIYSTARLSEAITPEGYWRNIPLSKKYLLLPSLGPGDQLTAQFVATIKRAYHNLTRPTGYAEVADLRDQVCFELRIPDYLFDELLKRCLIASQDDRLPFRIYLDSSLSQPVIILKRAPLDLKEGTFNLIRIHSLNK